MQNLERIFVSRALFVRELGNKLRNEKLYQYRCRRFRCKRLFSRKYSFSGAINYPNCSKVRGVYLYVCVNAIRTDNILDNKVVIF